MKPGNPVRIAITSGEPAGIGPELCVKIAQYDHACELVVIGDAQLLQVTAQQLNLPLKLLPFTANESPTSQKSGSLKFLQVDLKETVNPGELCVANAAYVLQLLQTAVQACLAGQFQAMVTAPIHKGIINESGIAFTGHTEFLAQLTNTVLPVMMLETKGLRVALATTHLPLRAVSDAITQDLLENILIILHSDLQKMLGVVQPRIYVCGLNPHAGEDGHLGNEEQTVILPVMDKLRHNGMQLMGPYPADTLFTAKYLDNADAVLAMYHDQGLPVLKYKGFGNAINVTLGLPIVRTSVDHGTALEIAGQGLADSSSLELAINAAVQYSQRTLTHNQ